MGNRGRDLLGRDSGGSRVLLSYLEVCRILASRECLLTAEVLTQEGAADNVGDLGIEPKESWIQRKLSWKEGKNHIKVVKFCFPWKLPVPSRKVRRGMVFSRQSSDSYLRSGQNAQGHVMMTPAKRMHRGHPRSNT